MGEKRVFSTRIDGELIRRLKHLAVDEDVSLGDLIESAIRELLEKHGNKYDEEMRGD